jgi:hypothetical protein
MKLAKHKDFDSFWEEILLEIRHEAVLLDAEIATRKTFVSPKSYKSI